MEIERFKFFPDVEQKNNIRPCGGIFIKSFYDFKCVSTKLILIILIFSINLSEKFNTHFQKS